ncbi:unnamed protein product [Dicrocoelium dendriticum]|nr:unnamed protein product [Dicrocoelium dendriticum]
MLCLLLFSALQFWNAGLCSSLTFELVDRDSRCFFSTMSSGGLYHIDFQVLSGGNYDVDFTLFGPDRKVVKHLKRSSYESLVLNDTVNGEYKACFGNLFSTVTHKVIYFSWYNISGVENLFNSEPGPNTLFFTLLKSLDSNLQKITFWQKMERLLNTISYNFMSQLNSRVLYWSIGQSVLVLSVGVGQVIVLRSLFSVPTSRRSTARPVS